jgi:hypothetical protein
MCSNVYLITHELPSLPTASPFSFCSYDITKAQSFVLIRFEPKYLLRRSFEKGDEDNGILLIQFICL